MRPSLRTLLVLVILTLVAFAGIGARSLWGGGGGLEITHAPARVSRKAMPLTANVIGQVGGDGLVRYRLNQGPWRETRSMPPRNLEGWFTVELEPAGLVPGGDNQLELEGGGAGQTVLFRYDEAPPELPIRIDWQQVQTVDLEVQDGAWEVVEVDGTARARPVPGTEGYDRILLLSGAFPGGRRVVCDVVLRDPVEKGRLWGFGPLPYWAGHPDPEDVRPRRGWAFSLSWYYSKYDAMGLEFSRKVGGEPMDWVALYRSGRVEPHRPWRCVVDAFAERTRDGEVVRHRMRSKWWPLDEAEPDEWLELSDRPGAPLLEEEFAVAFVAHRCQVEVGLVTIEALPDVVVDG